MRQTHRANHVTLRRAWPCKLPVFQRCFPSAALDDTVNERLALHGTTRGPLDSIMAAGFDDRLARQGGLYGVGIYFAEESCKAAQYCDASGEKCIVLSRVVLGDPFFTKGPMRGERRPPLRAGTHYVYDSIVAEVNIPNGRQGGQGRQEHREFVLFDRMQAYPELVIFFTD